MSWYADGKLWKSPLMPVGAGFHGTSLPQDTGRRTSTTPHGGHAAVSPVL